jgi:hypothetical protein
MNEKLRETVEGMRAQLVEALLIALKEKQAEYIEEEEDKRYFCAERDTTFELGQLIEEVHGILDAPQLVVLTAIAGVLQQITDDAEDNRPGSKGLDALIADLGRQQQIDKMRRG